jgi:RimJ/RimL family protein N-acetyltransferase
VTGSGNGIKVQDAQLVCGGINTAHATVYMIDTALMPPAVSHGAMRCGGSFPTAAGRDRVCLEMSTMPRELTDIPDEVRRVPAPPLPEAPEPYNFRLADPDTDAEMISEWMNRPHLASTWQYDYPPSRWHRHLSRQLEGTYSRPLISSLNGKDFMYLEIFRAAKDYIATQYKAEPYDMGLHGAIADPTFLNKGHAQHVVRHVVNSVFNVEPRCRRFMFDTDVFIDAMGRRFCERFGCVFLGEYDTPNRRIALFTFPRSTDLPWPGEVSKQ